MAQRWRVFTLVFLVNGLTIIMTVPHGIWAPAMFERVWKLSRPEIAFTLGIMTLTFGASSQFIAGTILDRLERAGIANPVPLFGIIVCVLAFLPGVCWSRARLSRGCCRPSTCSSLHPCSRSAPPS
jgi:MFS family permease